MKSRNTRGQSLIELSAGLIVFIPLILFLIDGAVIMIGASVNEAACRDAARAASAGQPNNTSSAGTHNIPSSASPYKRAQAILKTFYSSAGLVSVSSVPSVTETLSESAAQGAPLTGEVTVQTTATVNPPFLIRAIVSNGAYTFKCRQSYPYTYVQPAS